MEFIDLRKQYLSLRSEIDDVVRRVMESGVYLLGQETENLEKEMASFHGVRYAVGVGSGTEALFISLRAAGVKPGDEVITTPFTFAATANAICMTGARPVFADIQGGDFNIDSRAIQSRITARTKAVIPVHLFGQPCDMDDILGLAQKHSLLVIEDAAQAIGAEYNNQKVGSFGCLSGLSFFPIKNLGAFGNGGMILTNDRFFAEKIKLLRSQGSSRPNVHEFTGISGELDEIQAAVLRVKLRNLKHWNKKRKEIAKIYADFLDPVKDRVKLPTTAQNKTHVFYSYPILAERRDDLRSYLKERGVPTRVYYAPPLHLQTAFQFLKYRLGDFPTSEWVANSIVSLPIYPEMDLDDIEKVAAEIVNFYKNTSHA